ncbi:hypothetical protein ABKV19_001785 [Rosa sericea]
MENQTVLIDLYGCVKSIVPEHQVPVKNKDKLEYKCEITLENLRSGRIYLIDTKTDPKSCPLHKIVDSEDIVQKTALAYPHTSHCLASGDFFSLRV